MRTPSWIVVGFALVMALPFGWGLGVMLAYLIAGRDFGQLPAATVPLGLVAAVGFAVSPRFDARTRLKVMLAGTAASVLFGWLFA
jgi:hypothetical protein